MDVNHQFGADIVVGAGGDLLTAVGDNETQQRILRRLLTPNGSYIWHTGFGAGLPARVGDALSTKEVGQVQALIQGQLLLEPDVARNPPPQITVQPTTNGLSVGIVYTDAITKKPQVLQFTVQP